ncbi:LTA synthase family protein [Aliamphritea hakodatensis]|uniref:LTA synthase family protein n=1 Tax=Aliamphritea hakodatensis TaxID=2895352 RepID=UPI0022FDB072|nr:alkaline phosphatase family protein [Aliamphritea hakodatensis]
MKLFSGNTPLQPAQNNPSLPRIFLISVFGLTLLSSFMRLCFYLLNQDTFALSSVENTALAFVHGIRFDLVSIMLLLSPWLLVAMPMYVFRWNRLLQFSSRAYMLFASLLVIALNLMDSVYFPFTGRRSGMEVLSFASDLQDQTVQLALQYWYMIIIGLVILIASQYCLQPALGRTKSNSRWYLRFTYCLILVLVTAALGRGSTGPKQLKPIHAFSWPEASVGNLVLNTPFMLMRQRQRSLEKVDYFSDDRQAYEALDRAVPAQAKAPTKDNVVLIILESFSMEYLNLEDNPQNYAPFLQTLMAKGLVFDQAYANGRRSIDALPSIIAGLPNFTKTPYVRSSYQSSNLIGIGNILQQEGYDSAFFHGANNGSMYVDSITKRLGFEHFYGRREYPHEEDFDGNWGIYDEPFLQFSADKINQLQAPFIAGIFTLSSHNPYKMPPQYEGQFQKGELPIHELLGYVDFALENFFKKASTMPWYDNTLFVITADHTAKGSKLKYNTALGQHQVPIILYHPAGHIQPERSQRIAQHTDIPATIIDYLGLQKKYFGQLLPFSTSLISPVQKPFAFFQENNQYYLIRDNQVLVSSKDFARQELLPFNGTAADSLKKAPLTDYTKALIQYYNNGLINNTLYAPLKQP